jgi:hypothetical protein
MTVMTMSRDAIAYYAMSGPFTDLSAHGAHVRELPRTLPELCQVVQGLIVHPFHAELYGLTPRALRQDEVQIRSASAMLDRILALDPRPLSNPRPAERRFVGNCRHFIVLLCAFLRAHGASARARCGFGAYFEPAWTWRQYGDPTVLALLDRVAELTQTGDERHAQVLALHDSEPGLRVPRKIVSFGPGGGATVDLGPGFA